MKCIVLFIMIFNMGWEIKIFKSSSILDSKLEMLSYWELL